MTLQRKFMVLLLVLALAVIANLGAALWALRFAQGEFIRPLVSIKLILPKLGDVKDGITTQAMLLGGSSNLTGFPFPPEPEAKPGTERLGHYNATETLVAANLDQLESLDDYTSMVGISTARNLRARVGQATIAGRLWLTGNAADPASAVDQYKQVHDLIERMEKTVTASGTSAVEDYVPTIRGLLLLDLLASLSIVILVCVLGTILFRRWVIRPVRDLREAADRLAKGDFSHRVPAAGQDELGLLSEEINHMAAMISSMQEERVDRERLAAAGEVVRRLAHNLRNPLAGIRSLAELTRNGMAQSDVSRENQDRILQTVDRFERWLAGVLSATTPLQVIPQRVQVAGWLTGLVETLRPSAAARGVSLKLDTALAPAAAMFDPRHMEQALVGIIDNAIQASTSGQTVSIHVRTCEDGRSWELGVSDQGPGVPAALSEKIFRPYFTTKRDGTGIGLAVAKQVVDQHAGQIRLESPAGGLEPASGSPGARFLLSLPLAGPSLLANTGQ